MPTLRSVVSRSDLRLRFLVDEGGHRYGDRYVRGVIQADWTVDELTGYEGPQGTRALLQGLLVVVRPDFKRPQAWDADPERAETFLTLLANSEVAGVVLDLDWAEGKRFLRSWITAADRHGVPLLAAPDGGPQTYVRLYTAIEQERRREHQQDADLLRGLQRHVGRQEGLAGLLRQVAHRVDGCVVLVDRAGRVQCASPAVPEGILGQVREEIGWVATGRIRSAAVSATEHEVQILSIGDEEPTAVLVVVKESPFTPDARRLIVDVAGLVWARWRLDELGRREEQVDAADRHNREAVLHLLMVGHLSGARRAASALGSPLADVVQVYVVECPQYARGEVVAQCDEALGGKGWIVRM